MRHNFVLDKAQVWMCGIAGLWRLHPPVEEEELRRLCAALVHRGPDGEGIWLHPSGKLGLAHRRLAIVDLSEAGAQPMESPSGRSRIVFNGEIYNFPELRQELSRRGWCFRSRSDTEVILALYEQEGIACLEWLRGMFAFALWDEAERCLWLVRDRLGIKPVYYYWDGVCFAFASELGPLVRLRHFDALLDATAVWDFLTYHYIPAPKSIYRHVRKLEAGTWLRVDLERGQLQQQRYWRLPAVEERAMSESEAEAQLEELLDTVVREHLLADVPLGAFFSGGVDSSVVVAYARRYQPLWVFTADFDSAQKSERVYAEAAARHLGVRQSVVKLTGEDFFPSIERFVQVYGEPFGDSSGIAVMAISRAARGVVKAVLSGDGGDELFGGYLRSGADVGQNGLPLRSRRVVPWLLRTLPTRRGQRWLWQWLVPEERIVQSALWLQQGQKRRFFSSEFLALLPAEYEEEWFVREHVPAGLSPVRQRLLLDLQTWLPEKMLVKVDRAAMAFGLEVRVPLVDHRIVEWVCRVPEHLLWSPQRGGKWLLKRLLQRELPAELVYRPKKGFSIPLGQWLEQTGWQERVRQSRFWREGIFHRQLFGKAELRSPVTAFLVLVLAVWSDQHPWYL